MSTNKERQADEIEVLQSVCRADEFYWLSMENSKLALDVAPSIETGSLVVRFANVSSNVASSPTYDHFTVKNLPPASLRFQLPPEYPEKEAPNYNLEISWLAPWECSLICQRLDELWEENKGFEILFIWRDFLQSEILEFLGYKESLDVSFLFAIHHEPDVEENIALLDLSDSRASNALLSENPMEYLTAYDEWRKDDDFNRSILMCEICFLELPGYKCIEFGECGHFYCKKCTAQYITTQIQDGNVMRIRCPTMNCKCIAQNSQIKKLCPNLYPKYEQLLLDITLRTMNDVVFCPRRLCQLPVIVTPGETLANCSYCDYNFCFYCRKVYHGVAPCVMESEEISKLVNTYVNGSVAERENLIRKYGRRQIQSVIENSLSKDYLQANTKECPECRTATEKIEGCNKMCCSHCGASFCWLCGTIIRSDNKYDHFTVSDGGNACHGRLFEGMMPEEMGFLLPDDHIEEFDEFEAEIE